MGILSRIFGPARDPLEELEGILENLEKGTLDCGEANRRLARLGKPIEREIKRTRSTRLAERAWKVRAAETLDEDLLDMTSFENRDLECFRLVRTILNEHPHDVEKSDPWAELNHRSGHLSNLFQCTCRSCGFTYAHGMIRDLALELPRFCESCGDMTLVRLDHEDDEEARHCRCGGELILPPMIRCVRCGGDAIQQALVSRYQYFQTHNCYKYPLYACDRERIVREHPDT